VGLAVVPERRWTASRRKILKIRKRFSADENTGFAVNTGQVASLSIAFLEFRN
jgi:hypothetical protein